MEKKEIKERGGAREKKREAGFEEGGDREKGSVCERDRERWREREGGQIWTETREEEKE